MRNLLFVLLSVCFVCPQKSYSDEGMWLPILIERLNIDDMQKRGLQLSAEEIYSVNNAFCSPTIRFIASTILFDRQKFDFWRQQFFLIANNSISDARH